MKIAPQCTCKTWLGLADRIDTEVCYRDYHYEFSACFGKHLKSPVCSMGLLLVSNKSYLCGTFCLENYFIKVKMGPKEARQATIVVVHHMPSHKVQTCFSGAKVDNNSNSPNSQTKLL